MAKKSAKRKTVKRRGNPGIGSESITRALQAFYSRLGIACPIKEIRGDVKLELIRWSGKGWTIHLCEESHFDHS